MKIETQTSIYDLRFNDGKFEMVKMRIKKVYSSVISVGHTYYGERVEICPDGLYLFKNGNIPDSFVMKTSPLIF